MREAIFGALLFLSACGGSPSPGTPTPEVFDTWRGLRIAPENRCSSYNAADYPYPQSVEDQIVAELGGVYSPYTGTWFASKRDTDIEHIVARSEAHDSGLCTEDGATKRRFASDLLNLTLASPQVNRCDGSGKCAHDAAEWLPLRNQCWFAGRVLAVRKKYRLTVDRLEAAALDRVLSGCGGYDWARQLQILPPRTRSRNLPPRTRSRNRQRRLLVQPDRLPAEAKLQASFYAEQIELLADQIHRIEQQLRRSRSPVACLLSRLR